MRVFNCIEAKLFWGFWVDWKSATFITGSCLQDCTKRIPLAISLRAYFHFNRIVARRTVFLCFVNSQIELMDFETKKYDTFGYYKVEVEPCFTMAKFVALQFWPAARRRMWKCKMPLPKRLWSKCFPLSELKTAWKQRLKVGNVAFNWYARWCFDGTIFARNI